MCGGVLGVPVVECQILLGRTVTGGLLWKNHHESSPLDAIGINVCLALIVNGQILDDGQTHAGTARVAVVQSPTGQENLVASMPVDARAVVVYAETAQAVATLAWLGDDGRDRDLRLAGVAAVQGRVPYQVGDDLL